MTIEAHYRANFEVSVKKLSRALGHHNAEDVVQDTYVRIIQYNVNPDSIARIFNTVLANCIRAKLKDDKTKGMVNESISYEQDAVDPVEASPEDILASSEVYDVITNRILNKRGAAFPVLWSYFVLQQPYETIREHHPEISVSNMRKIIHDFRRELREEAIV